ncbi:MAG TPA: ATP-binding protein [Noviherbaspirillum sp.]|nr:ATP-binding protein [Noviherbaspirillum sp.]
MKQMSIRRRLLALLLGSVLVVWSAMLAYGYLELSEEVDEMADARLEQNARTLMLLDLKRLHALADNDGERRDGRERDHHDDDDDDHHDDDDVRAVGFQVWDSDGTLLMRTQGAPASPFDQGTGHGTLKLSDGVWHTFALRDADDGYQVRVFEKEETRSHLVNKLGRRMAQLLLLALPVLALLVWISTGRGLAPLRTMSRAIGSRNADNLQPLALERVPSEAQPLADSLNKLLQRLSESIDRERSFTADAAHELRTPLAAIKVQAEVALAAENEDQRRHAIAQVIAGVHRTTHLAQQLLLLARLDHADSAQVQKVDLGHVAVDSAARHADAAERNGIELDVAVAEECNLQANPLALSILVDNLIDNAVKYGSAGGHVAVRVARSGSQLALSVKDDGPGVAPELRGRLTDRFFRIAGSGVEGSGLGLSIVDRIAKRYGGTVDIGDGLDGRGLGVTIRLPM